MIGLSLFTFGVAFLIHHAQTYGHALSEVSIKGFWPSTDKDHIKAKQVEEALWDVRRRMYRFSIKFLIHICAVASLGMLYSFYEDQCVTKVVQVACMLSVYLAHHAVLSESLSLTAQNLRFIYSCFYLSFVPFVLVGYEETEAKAISNQAFNAGSRIAMCVVFMDSRTTIPFQIAISVAETCAYACQHSAMDTVAFAWVQAVVAFGMTIVSVVLEYWVTSHISTRLDTEYMVSSFRRMLRGVCDGDVMVTEDMTISEDAECLKHLLMDSTSFKGQRFDHLIVPEELLRFRDFVERSSQDAIRPEAAKTPRCLRISLMGSSKIRVGVDLWHLPLTGRSHLLALREDFEARAAPPAECPGVHIEASKWEDETTASESSFMSQKSSGSLLQSFPELVDMTLCVDCSTHWFDVEQAHLSFCRQSDSSAFSMPSLRSLVRPTDWETVRRHLKQIGERGEGTMRLRLVDGAKRVVVANTHVSTWVPPGQRSDGSRKLCLNMTDMVFEDRSPTRERSLTPIEESEE